MQKRRKSYIINNKRRHTNKITQERRTYFSFRRFFCACSYMRCSSHNITGHTGMLLTIIYRVSSRNNYFSFLRGKYITTHLKKRIRERENGKRVRAIKHKMQRGSRINESRAHSVKNSALYRELNRYQEEGIPLWLDGKPSTSYQIASRVCETTNYMRDYHTDAQNHICGIGFDYIRTENQQAANSPCAGNLRNYEYFLKKSKIVRRKSHNMI